MNLYAKFKNDVEAAIRGTCDVGNAEITTSGVFYTEISVGRHSVTLAVYDNEGNGNTLKMNFSCFGNFSADDEDEVAYAKIVGEVASHLDELAKKIIPLTVRKLELRN